MYLVLTSVENGSYVLSGKKTIIPKLCKKIFKIHTLEHASHMYAWGSIILITLLSLLIYILNQKRMDIETRDLY